MIVFPMVGLSSRFFKAGYTEPKYKLPFGEETVFSMAVKSFKHYFTIDDFLFIVRPDYGAKEFVNAQAKEIGVSRYEIVVLPEDTKGQAETVYLGIKDKIGDFPLLIFNIDTFRYDYKKPEFINEGCDGYLEVFIGEGEHWSFIEPENSLKVKRTTEKDRISNLCSDGLYYFKDKNLFEELFLSAKSQNKQTNNEYYIAPLYNEMIHSGYNVYYQVVPTTSIGFCGTPEEYIFLLQNK